MSEPEIRTARPEDLPAVVDILNHYVVNDHSTFDTEAWSVAAKTQWFRSMSADGPYQLLVAADSGEVAGYVHSGPFRPKHGYRTTVETTVYLHPEATGRGLGHDLLATLLARLERERLHRAIAIICQPNEASNRLHERLGFRAIGTLTEVGTKFGRFWDCAWYERSLGGTTP